MESHIINLKWVMVGSSAIRKRQEIMERIGITGTYGVLNGRSKSGLCLLNTITDADTIINAAKVPIFTSSAKSLKETNAAIKDAATPTNSMPFRGVLKFL